MAAGALWCDFPLVVIMCEWWLAHMAGGSGVHVVGDVSVIGCCLRLLCCGSSGWLVMCEWRLSHCGVIPVGRCHVFVAAGAFVGVALIWSVVCEWWLTHCGAGVGPGGCV